MVSAGSRTRWETQLATRRTFLSALGAICTAGVAGCSGDGGATPSPTAEPTATPSPTPTPTATPPRSDLEAYYPFEGDTPTNEVTGNAATIEGTASTGAGGRIGNAIQVGESASDAIVSEALPLNGDAATIGQWWSYASHGSYGRVFQVGGSVSAHPTAGYDVEFTETSDEIWFILWEGDEYTRSDPVSVGADTWYYTVGVVDGDSARMHVFDTDGELDASPVTASGTRTRSESASIHMLGGDGKEIGGTVDEVRAYSRALSEDEVTRLYRTSNPTA